MEKNRLQAQSPRRVPHDRVRRRQPAGAKATGNAKVNGVEGSQWKIGQEREEIDCPHRLFVFQRMKSQEPLGDMHRVSREGQRTG